VRPNRILYLNPDRIAVFTWRRGRLTEEAVFTAGRDGEEAFGAHLAADPDCPTALLVDVVEEEHYRDVVPHIGRKDQRAVVDRKLVKLFHRTPFRVAEIQSRASGNRTDAVLLSGLTKPGAIRPWLALMERHRVPLTGIYTPTVLGQALLKLLDIQAATTLLVTQQAGHRYRHSFFNGRNLVGSRMLLSPREAPATRVERIRRQLVESRRYFNPSFAPTSGQVVDAVVLSHGDTLEALQAAGGAEGFRYHCIDINAAARKLDIDRELREDQCEQLYVQLLRRITPTSNFAPPDTTRYRRLYQTRRAVKAACIALAIAGAAGGSYDFVGAIQLRQESADVLASVDRLRAEYDRQALTLPRLFTDPLQMEHTVKSIEALRRHSIDPGAVMSLVSTAIEPHPKIRIDKLNWMDGLSLSRKSVRPALSRPVKDGEMMVILTGHVEHFDGDLVAAFEQVSELIRTLRGLSAIVAVEPALMPVNVDPDSTLVGEETRHMDEVAAGFELHFIVRPGDEQA